MKKQCPKSDKNLVRFRLDEEVSRLAKGKKTVSSMTQSEILKWAASSLRAVRIQRDAANLHATKIADDVRFLERLWNLEDHRG